MKIQKDKRGVKIACKDGCVIQGFIHINPGERISDFINNPDRSFIAVTEAYVTSVHETIENITVILNKLDIKYIIENQ
jgi:hypothetical protein